jgi:hypothetical protein
VEVVVRILKTGWGRWVVKLSWLSLCSVAFGTNVGVQSVILGWVPSGDPTVVGYYLYSGTTNGVYNSKINVGTNTVYTVNGLIDGSTNYFTATSYDASGVESTQVPQVTYVASDGLPDLTVTAASVSRPFGQANPVFTGAITGLQIGDVITAIYSCSATSSSPAGTYPILPTLVDLDDLLTNYAVSLIDGTLTISQAVPLVTWSSPAPTIYGAALSASQLNATASVPGSFAYTPANGAALNAGTSTLSVIFTPTDAVDYSSVTESVNLVVSPAPLTVTAANASRASGAANPAFTGTITGLKNGDNITATYSTTATASSPVGTYSITPTLVDPANHRTNYTVSLVNGALTVTQTALLVTWTNPAPITYGAALGNNQLNATANVPGTFAYTPASGAALNTGTNSLSVIFTPTDTVDYSSASDSVTVVVSPAPLTVTAANAFSASGAANPAFTGTITGLKNGDNITATYSTTATTSSPVGTYSITPTLVDPANRETNYTVSLVDGTLTITQAGEQTIPQVTWTSPASIIYGAPLTINQLNATANVPGAFAYTPTNGAALNSGTSTLSVIFTPTDTVDYSSVTDKVSLVVSHAPLTVTAANAFRAPHTANPAFTGTITGLENGDNITATYKTTATSNSRVGTYPITPTLVDPGNRRTNYTVTLVDGTLTVTETVPLTAAQLTWTNPAPIIYGAALGAEQLNATANVSGTFAYTPANGAALNTGTNTLSVVFTPTDTAEYSSATDSVSLVVSLAPLTATAANASRASGAANPVLTGTITGLQNKDNITATYSTTATASSPVGTYPITPTVVDPDNRRTNYTVTLVDGTLTITSASGKRNAGAFRTVTLIKSVPTVPGSPVIHTAKESDNSFTLTWETIPGRQYQVLTTTDLDQNNWTALGDAITASNSIVTVSEPFGANSRQFYRVMLLP